MIWQWLIVSSFACSAYSLSEPVVHSRASIYHGRHLPEFNQDLFLGIKYAPEPIRFTPSALNHDSPQTYFNASNYGIDCYGLGSDTDTLTSRGFTTLGEDCLNLNIVKPAGNTKGLPVLLWIYGGGWVQGATSDPRYLTIYILHLTGYSYLCLLEMICSNQISDIT